MPDPDSDPRTLRTARTLPYTATAIYGAFASPQQLAAWWGPEGFSNSFEVFEFTAGGRWQFVMHGPDGTDYANECVFAALEPARRVVIRHTCAPLFTLTVELQAETAAAGATRITWEQAFDDAATAEAVRAVCEPANEQNLDRLARVLAGAPAR
ncbi:MAG: SRPBCC domain-containing protein [Rubrivivax sp.]|nr:SRPBCC domain-containing protein [Rubrivivax sp.]